MTRTFRERLRGAPRPGEESMVRNWRVSLRSGPKTVIPRVLLKHAISQGKEAVLRSRIKSRVRILDELTEVLRDEVRGEELTVLQSVPRDQPMKSIAPRCRWRRTTALRLHGPG